MEGWANTELPRSTQVGSGRWECTSEQAQVCWPVSRAKTGATPVSQQSMERKAGISHRYTRPRYACPRDLESLSPPPNTVVPASLLSQDPERTPLVRNPETQRALNGREARLPGFRQSRAAWPISHHISGYHLTTRFSGRHTKRRPLEPIVS
jgi:hypothetical protein